MEASAALTAQPAPVVDTEARAQLEALRQELANSRRVETIRAECAQHGLPQDAIEKLIKENATLEVARGVCLDYLRAARPQPGAPAIVHNPEASREAIVAGLLFRAGGQKLAEIAFANQPKVLDFANRARGVSLLDATREALRVAGHRYDYLDPEETIRAGFTTGTLPYILGSAAGKFLMQGWSTAPASWRQICGVVSVPDFKGFELLRLQDVGDLEEIAGTAEVPFNAQQEDREQLKAKTYALQWGISRQNIINDDLSVFSTVPRLMGRRASLRLSKLAWEHVMSNPTMNDAVAFFHATHANLTGTLALGADNLGTAIKGFRSQTDANGDPIDVSPAVLAVPPALEELGKQLCYSDIILPYGGTSGTTRRPTKNIWANGTLACLAEPRLGNTNYTNASDTTWYLFANPEELPAAMVGFLNGQENPVIEQYDLGPDRIGIAYRVRIDAGVRVAEYRAASKQTA